MKQNIQPNLEPDVEQYFPGEEPFSRQKRERQRQVALYLTLIVGAVLLTVGVTLRYTLLAETYKPAPYQPPSVASVAPEESEEVIPTPQPAKASAGLSGGAASALPSDIRAAYFSDAPDSGNALTAPATPSPAPTPISLVPNAVENPTMRLGESITPGEVIQPIEVVPVSRDVTPSVRLFEMPSTQPAEPPKLTAMPKGVSKPGALKTTELPGGLKVNITAPTITTIPSALSPSGDNSGQPSSGSPSTQPGTPAPSSGPTTAP